MKKSMISFLAVCVFLCSCEKSGTNEIGPESEKGAVATLTATTSSFTRTSMDDALQIKWSEGDQIAVYSDASQVGTEGIPYTLTEGAGTTAGTFVGEGLPEGTIGYAIYPYNASHNGMLERDGVTGFTAMIPQTQTYVENSIPEEAFIMAGSFDPTEGKISFQPMAAVLEFKLYGNLPVSRIEVRQYESEAAIGMNTISLNPFMIGFDEGGTPELRPRGEGSRGVFLDCPTSVTLGADPASATSFFIAVGGKAAFHHLQVTVIGEDGTSLVKNTVNSDGLMIEFEPGIVYSLPAFEFSASNNPPLAKWDLANATNDTFGDFYMGTTYTHDAASPKAMATSGNGYVQFLNNDYTAEGNFGRYRTSVSTNDQSLVFCPVTLGDEIVVAATSCSLNAGDKVRLLTALWAYTNATSNSYAFEFSVNGTTWTKIADYTIASTGLANGIDINSTVTVPEASTQILFRFRATSNLSITNAEMKSNSAGQTRLNPSPTKGEFAIYKE